MRRPPPILRTPPWVAPSMLVMLLSTGPTLAQSFWVQDDWTRNFRLGVQVTLNVQAQLSIDGVVPRRSTDPGPVGVPGRNHQYDDGYVRVDATGNAGGVTSSWGYQDASQYDPATDQLVYRSTRGFSARDQVTVDSGPMPGVEMVYGGRLHDWRWVRLGWEFGYAWVPMELRDTSTLPAQFLREVQAFDVGGISLPIAPYRGGSSGIGPVIPDISKARPDEVLGGFLSGSRGLDVDLHSFRLGPNLFWRFGKQWALSGSIGPAMGLLSGGYSYNETFRFSDGTTAANVGGQDKLICVFGGYVSATVLYRVVYNADLYVSSQFLSLGGAQYGGGGRRATLDLGQTVMTSIGISWPF
ncbi:MAG: hypothetical protein ACKO3H_13615 [Verrucomicrobiota bacterium]